MKSATVASRLGLNTFQVVGLLLLTSIVGLVITVSPGVGAAIVAITAFAVAMSEVTDARLRVAIPIMVLFLIPADEIQVLADRRMGILCLGVAVTMFVASALRGQIRMWSGHDWRFLTLVGGVLSLFAIHMGTGGSRGAVFWLAAGLISIWLWSERESKEMLAAGVRLAIYVSGAISGILGLFEYLGVLDLPALIPTYEPQSHQFTYLLGMRAAGLTGHPLKLGTVTMLACLIPLVDLLGLRAVRANALRGSLMILPPVLGLITSGARGSWLGLVMGMIAVVAAQVASDGSGKASRLIRLVLIAAIAASILAVSSFGTLISERVVGSASAPGSIGQRVAALETAHESASEIPILGLGPGEIEQYLYRKGLITPNLESDYLIFFMGFGWVGLVGLLVWSASLLRAGIRRAIKDRDALPLALSVAILINMGTYNFLTWSLGAAHLALVSFLTFAPRAMRPQRAQASFTPTVQNT